MAKPRTGGGSHGSEPPVGTGNLTDTGMSGSRQASPSGPETSKQEVEQKARAMGEEVQHRAREIQAETTERAKSMFAEQKGNIAQEMGGIAKALHETARTLDHQDQHGMAEYAERAAEGIESFSRTLRERDVDALLGQVQDFARRQPAVFLGGAVAAGFLLSRVMKSSAAGHGSESYGIGRQTGAGHTVGGQQAGAQRTETVGVATTTTQTTPRSTPGEDIPGTRPGGSHD